MGSRNDKGWKILFEKRADDEFLFHVKGIRKIVSILILTENFAKKPFPQQPKPKHRFSSISAPNCS